MIKTDGSDFVNAGNGAPFLIHWSMKNGIEAFRDLIADPFVARGERRPVPVVAIRDEEEYRGLWTSKRMREMSGLLDRVYSEAMKSRLIKNADGKIDAAAAVYYFLEVTDSRADGLNRCAQFWTPSLIEWLRIIILDLVAFPLGDSVAKAAMGALKMGFVPIVWMGEWPDGFLLVYPLQGAPIPKNCQPSAAQLLQGGYGIDGRRQKRATEKKTKKGPVTPKLRPSAKGEWNALLTGSPRSVFVEHFRPLATSEPCRAVLEKLAGSVVGVGISGDALLFRFRSAEDEALELHCSSPFLGAVDGLPCSTGAVVKMHNGMVLRRELQEEAIWYPFDGDGFDMEWDVWWTPDPYDMNEPFPVPPLVPVTDGYDIWLFRKQSISDGSEPALQCMSHHNGKLTKGLPYGAGGVFLRLLLRAMTDGEDDGGLEVDQGPPNIAIT